MMFHGLEHLFCCLGRDDYDTFSLDCHVKGGQAEDFARAAHLFPNGNLHPIDVDTHASNSDDFVERAGNASMWGYSTYGNRAL